MAAAVEQVREAHDELASMTERLIGEYETLIPAGSVIRCVARTVHDLRQDGVPATGLAELSEPLVRAQLDARTAVPGGAVIGGGGPGVGIDAPS